MVARLILRHIGGARDRPSVTKAALLRSLSTRSYPRDGMPEKEREPPPFDLTSKLHLSKTKLVNVSLYEGVVLVDIRSYFRLNDTVLPTKKGISLTVDQWKRLKDAIHDVDRMVAAAEGHELAEDEVREEHTPTHKPQSQEPLIPRPESVTTVASPKDKWDLPF